MKVRIVKCSNPRLWYRDAVGGEFDAVASIADARDVRVLSHPEETTIRFINHGDYELVEDRDWRDHAPYCGEPCPVCSPSPGKSIPVKDGCCAACGREFTSNEVNVTMIEDAAQKKIRAITREEISDSATIAGLIDRVKAIEAWAGSLKEWVATLQRLVAMGVVKP